MLALALGKTRAELLSQLDTEELNLWAAFYGLNPFGLERHDLGHAVTACTVANALRAKRRPFEVADFLPRFRKEPPDQKLKKLRTWILAHGQPRETGGGG